MQNISQFLKDMTQEYSLLAKLRGFPVVEWGNVASLPLDEFNAAYSGGVVKVSASNQYAAAHGFSSLMTGIKSGHLPDFLGETRPKFFLRPLWIETLPSSIEQMCCRTIELGYNAVVFKLQEEGGVNDDVEKILSCLHSYGLKSIIRVSLKDQKVPLKSPIDPLFQEAVNRQIKSITLANPTIDYIFWESNVLHPYFFHHPDARDLTTQELVLTEIKLMENLAGENTGLIFYLPSGDFNSANLHAEWIPSLCQDVGSKTLIAFSAVSGGFCKDHLPSHPLWKKLRELRHASTTQLLPIVNVGCLEQGEGLWPTLTLDLIEEFFLRCNKRNFAGVVSLTQHLPAKGSLLDCSLWVAAQTLWRDLPPKLLAETWFSSFRPELPFVKFQSELKSIREIAVQLSLLRSVTNEKDRDAFSSEEGRSLAERLITHLKEIQKKFEKEEKRKNKRSERPSFYEYFAYFSRDARRIILHFLQCYNISLPNVLDGDDLQESFWTQISQGTGQGIRSGAKVGFLEQPFVSQVNNVMQEIWKENHL